MRRLVLSLALAACTAASPTEPSLSRKPFGADKVNRVVLLPGAVAADTGHIDTVIGTAYRQSGAVCGGCNIQFSLLGTDTARARIVSTFAVAGGTGIKGAVVRSTHAGTAKLRGGNNGVADTTVFTIIAKPAATITAMAVAPPTASLQVSTTQSFTASATWSDGGSHAFTAVWTATGGTITQAGLYTAGTVAGTSFHVIAAAGGKADTAEVTITGSVQVACTGVTIAAGASIQTAVNANPTNTVFCLSSGTYSGQTVAPKSGQQFIGARDSSNNRLTTLDGTSTQNYAFTGSVSNVVIQGMKIKNYTPPIYDGAVRGFGATGWQVLDNEIFSNAPGAGSEVFTGWIVKQNFIHDNGSLGITGQANSVGGLIDSNEVSSNNLNNAADPNVGAGGIKVVLSTNLTFRANYVHDNHGYGIWCDNCNATTSYLCNRVVNNTYSGLYHEVSDAAVMDSNTTTGNGTSTNRAGIWVDNSANVEIRNNYVSGNGNAIQLRELSRPDLPNRNLDNAWVHDNTIFPGAGLVGLVQFVSNNAWFTSHNNRFTANHYTLTSSGATSFQWMNASNTKTQWQAFGEDLTGTFLP